MVLNQRGDAFEYNGVSYKIGDKIYATDQSEYEGLWGIIAEIRDGEDKDTENETPDFYCCFDSPVLPYDVEILEGRFSELYREQKTLDDISLDEVIMSPEMIETVCRLSEQQRKVTIFWVDEDWAADSDYGHSIIPCTDHKTAKRILCEKLAEEKNNGCIALWEDSDDFICDSTSDSYECWLNDQYSECHYKVKIEVKTLLISNQDWGTMGRRYIDETRVEDFISQIEKIRETESLTDAQYQRLIKDLSIPERIHNRLGKNDRYWECYWDTISDVIHELIQEYMERTLQKECFTPEADNL